MVRTSDEGYMRRALELATMGLGRTWPNPMVGAVVVRNGRIVGTGWHRRYGGPHAEVHALRDAGARARGATLYVNLEPCSHQGRTPPCAPAVVRAGIRRVVAAMRDPNPLVSGKGFAVLRRAGLRVEVGLLGREARHLNRVFCKRVMTGQPYVICKAAISLDGKIACTGGASRWISGPAARRYAHQLRGLADVVIVGMNTVRLDDPELTVRLAPRLRAKPLRRVVLEGAGSLPGQSRLMRTAAREGLTLATVRWGSHPWEGLPGIEIWRLPGRRGRVRIDTLMQRLGEAGASLVLVEGGSEVHADFLGMNGSASRVWADEIHWIVAPLLLGGRRAPGPVGGRGRPAPSQGLRLRDITWKPLGNDWLVRARVADSASVPERRGACSRG